ncbi:putative lipid II flippase FtsW [Desulfohalovibrio reitneri]|uniref:putative lipid II flippase FtsW n=1 Tax=Desulfohalovibrio reitneri TaxID=1307759 RepID=UPI001F020AE7|nr:putative lipid II flippase FtsW [Desulfohalovibrio reitneri]
MSAWSAAVNPFKGRSVPATDPWLLTSALALTVVGLVMVFSSSAIMAERAFGDAYHFITRQSLFALAGVGVAAVAASVPRGLIYKLTYFWLGLALLLLVLTLVGPWGHEVNGAQRWLRVGPLNMQALEPAKVALVIYLAYFFSGKQDRVKSFSIGFLPPFLVTGLFAVLLLAQPDFGGAAFLCALLFLMCLAGGTRFTYLFGAFCMAAAGAAALIVNSPYRFKRLTAFLDPFKDALDSGYQLVQSLYAFGSGGAFGVGLGSGKQKLFFLPEAHNDFLMAVVGEETGFLGVSVVFLLIGLFLYRAFAVSLRQEDLRDRFTAYGLTLVLALGFLFNLAVVLGAAPPKGVPMPFVSYGGSQMLASFACLGLLLNLSRAEKPGVVRGKR